MGRRTGAQQRHRIHINLYIATELTLELMVLVKKYYEWATTPLLAIRKGIYSICIHWCDTVEDDLCNSACRQTFVTHILALHRQYSVEITMRYRNSRRQWSGLGCVWQDISNVLCHKLWQSTYMLLRIFCLFLCCFLCLFVCFFTSCHASNWGKVTISKCYLYIQTLQQLLF